MVFIGAAIVATAGMVLLDDLQSATNDEQGEQVMRQVDHDLSSEQGVIELLNDGTYNISQEGTINVTVTNPFGESCALLDDEPMGTLQAETDNGMVARQAGGIFRKTDGRSTVISNPDIRYYSEEIDGNQVNNIQVSLSTLQGSPGPGTNEVDYEQTDISTCPEAQYATEISIEVADTPYHHGWKQFLESEFNESSVTYDELNRMVSVEASLSGDRPFESFVGIDPTIYGGLYAENAELSIDDQLTVDRYNGSTGWHAPDPANVTEDILAATGDVSLGTDATVTGIPVANDELTGDPGADVSTLAYASNPGGTFIENDDATNTPLYNVTDTYPPAVYGAQMDAQFASIETVDDEIDRSIERIANSGRARSIEKTLSVPPGETDVLYHEDNAIGGGRIDEIDTSSGIIHVAVDGNLNLHNVHVKGDGQVYFYVSGKITANRVTIEDERARSLWLYGQSGEDVRIKDEFMGVLYAPGSDLTIEPNTDAYGAIVGGETTIRRNVDVHFDETLRTDVPIPEANQGVEIDQPGERRPVDVVFALDRSGSMELYNSEISGNEWHAPPFTGGFKVSSSESDPVEINDGEDVRTVHPGEAGVIEAGEEVKVDGEENCIPTWGGTYCWGPSVDVSTQNDPRGLRIDATKNFVGQMKPGDRAGAIEFNTGASKLTDHLYSHSNFDDFNASLEANAGGGTYIGGGIDEGLELYDPSSDSKKVMILLTDGMNDGTDEDNTQTKRIANDAAEDEVTIYTVGLGDESDIDEDLLQDIADKTGGSYAHVGEAHQLNQLFKNIGKGVQETSVVSVEVASFERSNDWSNEFTIDVRRQTIHVND